MYSELACARGVKAKGEEVCVWCGDLVMKSVQTSMQVVASRDFLGNGNEG